MYSRVGRKFTRRSAGGGPLPPGGAAGLGAGAGGGVGGSGSAARRVAVARLVADARAPARVLGGGDGFISSGQPTLSTKKIER